MATDSPLAARRRDPRREATVRALIEAAESLFGQAGVDGVSTRQIGAAIGSANTNVVAYHFGAKDALIEAVYHHRLPAIDARRGELLDQAIAADRAGDLPTLVGVFAQPLFEQVDGAGRHSYAAFVCGLERSGQIASRAAVTGDYPETERLMARIAALLPDGVRAQFDMRRRLAFAMIMHTLALIDRECAHDVAAAQAQFDNAVTMAAAALAAQ